MTSGIEAIPYLSQTRNQHWSSQTDRHIYGEEEYTLRAVCSQRHVPILSEPPSQKQTTVFSIHIHPHKSDSWLIYAS